MRRRAFLLLVPVALLLAGVHCTVAQISTDSSTGTVRVLFIGNSLTYINDVPGLVAGLARAGDGPRIETRTVAHPNFGLQDHWEQGEARAAIEEGWDVVVMQQGPSGLDASREVLLDYAARFAPLIRATGGRPALYTVWPSRERLDDFPRVVESYALAAEHVEGLLLPAGAAWESVLDADPTVPLYGPDQFHAGPEGAWLAAVVIWAGLTGESPREAPATVTRPDGTTVTLSASLATRLRDAAADALAAVSAPGSN